MAPAQSGEQITKEGIDSDAIDKGSVCSNVLIVLFFYKFYWITPTMKVVRYRYPIWNFEFENTVNGMALVKPGEKIPKRQQFQKLTTLIVVQGL